MKLSNRLRGLKSKKYGEHFENILHGNAQRTKWNVIRIPDGCKQISAFKLIRTQTPFDFVFLKAETDGILTRRYTVFADAKTTQGDTFKHSDITDHQVDSLFKIHSLGFTAGYVVQFREHNKTVFFRADQLYALPKRKSLKPEDGVSLGTSTTIDLSLIFK
jgi:penicillin-binding protein-related factor A (putative recombinase)